MEINDKSNEILDILTKKGSATIDYLAKKIYTSPSTIRRHLDILEKKGLIHRFHGGASIADYPTFLLSIDQRMHTNETLKKQIAYTASNLVANGDTIYIDSSSTAATLIPYLNKYKNIRIVTNSIMALTQLLETNHEVLFAGGTMFKRSLTFTGLYTEDIISKLYTDKMFFSVATLTQSGVLADDCEQENHMRLHAMKNATKKILLLDHSKLETISHLQFCHLKDIDMVVSDVDLRELMPWEDNYPELIVADATV